MGTINVCHFGIALLSKLFRNHTQYTESLILQISGGLGVPNLFRGEIADFFSQTQNNKQQQIFEIIHHHHSSSSTLFTINNDSTLLWFMMAAPLSQ
jgi:hypothetical protein